MPGKCTFEISPLCSVDWSTHHAKQRRLVCASNRDTVSLAAVPAHVPKNVHSAGSSLAPCLADDAQTRRHCLEQFFLELIVAERPRSAGILAPRQINSRKKRSGLGLYVGLTHV
jgi:hypothetical protein